MNTFEMKTAIHFGDNALDRLKEIPYKRVLIITDPFVVQSKMINLITAPLNSADIEYDIFHDVVPDAPVDKIAEGVKKFLEYQPEAVVAVGGGSPMDCAKAIGARIARPRKSIRQLQGVFKVLKLTAAAPFVSRAFRSYPFFRRRVNLDEFSESDILLDF